MVTVSEWNSAPNPPGSRSVGRKLSRLDRPPPVDLSGACPSRRLRPRRHDDAGLIPGPIPFLAPRPPRPSSSSSLADRPTLYLKSPTAREMTSAITIREIADCTIIVIFAQRASGIVSVGLNEHALVNETYR